MLAAHAEDEGPSGVDESAPSHQISPSSSFPVRLGGGESGDDGEHDGDEEKDQDIGAAALMEELEGLDLYEGGPTGPRLVKLDRSSPPSYELGRSWRSSDHSLGQRIYIYIYRQDGSANI
eukprot:7786-Pyramimonas_sp.AAC.1